MTVQQRLSELGIELPQAPAPLASYVPTRTVPLGGGRSLFFVAGHVNLDSTRAEGWKLLVVSSGKVAVGGGRQAAR